MRKLTLALIPLLAIACNNTESTGGPGGPGGAGGTGATSTTGTAGSTTGGTGGGDTTLQPPDTGVQLTSGETKLAAGSESYKCWTFDLPKDAPLALTGIETQLTSPAIHHYGIFTNSDASAGSDAYDCEQMGVTWGLVSGGGLGTPPMIFPEGTAMTLAAGSHIVLQLHLLNASSEEVTVPEGRVNLIGAKDPANLQPVGLLITGTLKINVPAQTKGVDVSGSCQLSHPMEHVFMTFPHMHKLGRRIASKVTPADGSADRMVSDITWDFSDQGVYKADTFAAAGDTVTTTCTYDNPTSSDIQFGLSSNAEMCVSVLYYYPADTMSEYCGIP